jgi:hypothetical protein
MTVIYKTRKKFSQHFKNCGITSLSGSFKSYLNHGTIGCAGSLTMTERNFANYIFMNRLFHRQIKLAVHSHYFSATLNLESTITWQYFSQDRLNFVQTSKVNRLAFQRWWLAPASSSSLLFTSSTKLPLSSLRWPSSNETFAQSVVSSLRFDAHMHWTPDGNESWITVHRTMIPRSYVRQKWSSVQWSIRNQGTRQDSFFVHMKVKLQELEVQIINLIWFSEYSFFRISRSDVEYECTGICIRLREKHMKLIRYICRSEFQQMNVICLVSECHYRARRQADGRTLSFSFNEYAKLSL